MRFSYENSVPVDPAQLTNYIEVSKAYAESVNGFALISDGDQKILVPVSNVDVEGIAVNLDKEVKFVVPARASISDVQELLRLQSEINKLSEKAEEIKSRIQLDASLALSNTAYGTYEIKTALGSVEVVSKDTVEVVSASLLRKFLHDELGQLVIEKPATYKLSSPLIQVLAAIENDMFLDVTPEEYIDSVAAELKNDNLVYEKTRRALKKTFASNVKVFMNTFGYDYDKAVDAATMYQMCLNWEMLGKIAACSGYTPYGEEWRKTWRQFVEKLRVHAFVRQTSAIVVKCEDMG